MKQFMSSLFVCFVCFVGLMGSSVLASEGSLILPDQVNGNVEIILQNETSDLEGSDVLQVFVGPPEACCDGKSPIAGMYQIEGRRVVFDPAFDFIEGQSYTVQSQNEWLSLTTFAIDPKEGFLATEVVAVYPSGDSIPENTLRFYVQFSTPMTPHLAGEFIKLIDANGATDTAAFMMFTQELWNQDRTRLTLLMDPGRIKRGVAQNLRLGPALLEGHRYSIVVEDGWPSARGGHKAPRFEKSFIVSKALRTLPDIRLWNVQKPRIQSNDPLLISFDRPFDRQLAQTAITVRDADGQIVAGTVSIEDFEKTWRFVPDNKWATPTIGIYADANLEDVAGNNFNELLDHSLGSATPVLDHHVISLTLIP